MATTANGEGEPYDLATPAHDYPEWIGPPKRSILICTHPRSGSTMLGEALYFAGDLGCPLEYLHAGFRPRFAADWKADDTNHFVREMWRRRTAPNGTLAVKLMWCDVQQLAQELDPEGLAEIESTPPESVAPATYRRLGRLLETMMPRPIWVHLHRRDRLRQAVSATIAVQTGQWRSIPGAEMLRACEPAYDDAAVNHFIGYSDFCHGHWRNLITAIGAPSFTLTYEDLVRDYAGNVTGLLKALGRDAAPPPVRMQRQADRLSETFVARYLQQRGIRMGA